MGVSPVLACFITVHQQDMKPTHTIFFLFIMAAGMQAKATTDSVATPANKQLAEVTVKSSNKQMLQSLQMGKVDVPMRMLMKAPAIGGEVDVVKALQLTPGVKGGTEGSIGMYVRGGANDENLILLDGAPLYNAGHLLGFFSVFNNTALKDVQLYKSGFAAQYGGRLSSVMDVRTKDASLSGVKAQMGIGTISSSACIEAPIIKDKLSVMVAGRRTYIDKVMKNIPYHFHDVNVKLYYMANTRNRFYISSYTGRDVLRAQSNTDGEETQNIQSGMKMGNNTMSLRWNSMSKDNKASSDVTAYYSGFSYDINGKFNSNDITMLSSIRDAGVRADVRLSYIKGHKITAGASFSNRFFHPNRISSSGPLVERFGNNAGQRIHNNEAAVYVNDEVSLGAKTQVAAGIRISSMLTTGKTYINPEPRIAMRYSLNDNSSVKLSYARMVQYMYMVSGSSLMLPTDMWYPASANLQPANADQISAGYYHNIANTGISLSAEVYYKWMHNLCEYKEGAVVIQSKNYENEMVQGSGKAYGLELFAGKTAGRFSGWAGYTLAFAHRRFDSLNNGKDYYARYDRRHQLSVVAMYDITKSWSISATTVYATGAPFTGQTSQYLMPKPGFTGFEAMPAYTGRNELRMSAQFRTDADLQYKFNISKRIKADAHLSVYNIFNRTQPHSVQRVYDEQTKTYKYQQRGLFGTITALSLNVHL